MIVLPCTTALSGRNADSPLLETCGGPGMCVSLAKNENQNAAAAERGWERKLELFKKALA